MHTRSQQTDLCFSGFCSIQENGANFIVDELCLVSQIDFQVGSVHAKQRSHQFQLGSIFDIARFLRFVGIILKVNIAQMQNSRQDLEQLLLLTATDTQRLKISTELLKSFGSFCCRTRQTLDVFGSSQVRVKWNIFQTEWLSCLFRESF